MKIGYWGVGLLLINTPLVLADTIKATPLVAVKNSQEAVAAICATLKPHCVGENIKLLHAKGSQDNTFYLIDELPRIIKLSKDNSKQADQAYQVVTEWDFSQYPHSADFTGDYDRTEEHLTVYPALYPLSADKSAVAILKQGYSSYSGGGAGASVAEFVMLKEDGSYQTAFKHIPFSETSMIRACFSEQEYKTSPHCHDEEWMVLLLAFKEVGQPYYQWQFTFETSRWDAFKSIDTTEVTTTTTTGMPFAQ